MSSDDEDFFDDFEEAPVIEDNTESS